MTFEGARTTDDPGLRMDRLARMAEADNWIHSPEPVRRRRKRDLFGDFIGMVTIIALALIAYAVVGP